MTAVARVTPQAKASRACTGPRLPNPTAAAVRPDDRNRQGNDIGPSYRSVIFYLSDAQKQTAEDTTADVDASGLSGKVVTEVSPAGPFWEAEPERQDYLERYPNGYTCHFVRPGWKLPRRANTVTS